MKTFWKNFIYILLLLFFVNININASIYYVDKDENESLKVFDENNVTVFYSIKELFNSLKDKDKVFFKRGKRFNASLDIEKKDGIVLGDYGDKNLSLPIISIKEKIAIDKNQIQTVYPKDFGEEFADQSWRNVEDYFNKIYNSLANFTGTKNKIAKSFADVKNRVYEILRFKLPVYPNFDPNALRLWMGDREILKAVCFEELNCSECGEKYEVRWFYENNSRYLYLFSMNSKIELKNIVDFLYINNPNYFTLKIFNSKNIAVKNLDIRDGKYSIIIRGSSDVNITGCIVGKGSFTGIYVTNDMDSFKIGSKNVLIDNCVIDGDFRFSYRFSSLRDSQDGIFFLNNVRDSVVKNSKFYHWGHTGINLSVSDVTSLNLKDDEIKTLGVMNNKIFKNTFDGKDMPYMRALSFDNRRCESNIFEKNVIKNMRVRSQINGSGNIVRYNIVYNIKNSQIKMDQGYGSGQGFQLEAYGSSNISSKNVIEKNLIMKTDEAAVSISGRKGYGNIEDNNISDNIVVNCGMNVFKNPKKDYNDIAFEVVDIDGDYSSIKNNNFILNKIYTSLNDFFVFYRGEVFDINNFNNYPKGGDIVKSNMLFTSINVSKMDSIDYNSDEFVLDNKYLYIYRLYLNIFKRMPDKGGLFYWHSVLKSEDSNESNSSLQSACKVAKFFFFSKEMQDSNLSLPEYVQRLYTTILNREPDEEGKNYWISFVKDYNIKKEEIFYEFITSNEFQNLAKNYNILAYDSKDLLSSFVERLYILILERMFDIKGRDYWVLELESGRKSAVKVVKNFFHSKEFLDKNVTNERFVDLSYLAILNRKPDKEGKNYWLSKLDENLTRDDIIDKFLNSPEFQNLASRYHIKNIK